MFQSWNKILKDSADSIAAVANAKLEEMRQSQAAKDSTSEGKDPTPTPAVVLSEEPMEDNQTPSISELPKDSLKNDPAASKNYLTEAGKAIDSFIFAHCATCKTKFNLLTNINHKCRICSRSFCTNCIEQSKFPIPNDLLHRTAGLEVTNEKPEEGTTATTNATADKVQYVCKEQCLTIAVDYCMNLFRENMNEKFLPILLSYLESHYQYRDYYPLPISPPDDTAYRQALRFARIAEVVADFTGFSLTMRAVKYAFMSHELINALMSSDILTALTPFLENLKEYGITGPTAILNLFYLGCKHTLEVKQNYLLRREDAYQLTRRGVLVRECPREVLDYIARYVSPAQFLYVSYLPPPHHSNDWSAWYLSKMVARQQWTLLMCINDTTKLPNGNKCPAFALMARDDLAMEGEDTQGKTAASTSRKEALLIIRGSASAMDWSINLQENLTPFKYCYFSPATKEIVTVDGHGHSGIIAGAKTILEDYHLRHYLFTLFDNGFDIKIIGHSLGAGTSVFIAAELRTLYLQRIVDQCEGDAKKAANMYATKLEEAHRISATVFSAPAILSKRLADAFLIDRLLINVVNVTDIIPRYNRQTMQLLAKELKDFSVIANEWLEEDKMDLTNYALSAGRAADIHTLTSEETRLQRYLKIQAMKEKMKKKREKQEKARSTTSSSMTTTNDAKASSTSSTTASSMQGFVDFAHKSFTSTLASFQKPTAATCEGKDDDMGASELDLEVESIAIPSAPPAPSKPQKPEKPPRRLPPVSESKADEAGKPSSVEERETEESIPSLVLSPTAPLEPSSLVDHPKTGETLDPELTVAVAPSPVIHIYRDNSGMMKAAVVDYNHEIFQRMEVLPSKILKDHMMTSYRGAVEAARHSLHFQDKQRQQGLPGTASTVPFEEVKTVFPRAVDKDRLVQDLPYFIYRGQSMIPQMEPLLVPTRSLSMESQRQRRISRSLEDVNEVPSPRDNPEGSTKEAVQDSLFRQISKILTFGSTSAEAKDGKTEAKDDKKRPESIEMVDRGSTAVIKQQLEEETKEAASNEMTWLPCAVCGLEVTWPYILHSDGSRADATHNCSACGRIVCTLCAPTGEQLPGDGINTKYTVPDFRISLPWLGLYAPQRVCLHCYFDSTSPGLSTDHTHTNI